MPADRATRPRDAAGAALRHPRQGLSARGARHLCARVKWAVLIVLPRRLLPAALAALGPRPRRARPGDAARSRRPARLLLRPRDLAAGHLLPHRLADPRRGRPVPRHQPVRPRLVRLHLPADGVDRSLHVGRAPDRGRPQRAHAASTQRRCRSPRSGARPPSTRSGSPSRSATGGAWIMYFVDAPTTLVRVLDRRPPRSRSISSSACSPRRPTCWPAGRASRSAPTCARGRASRRRCSTSRASSSPTRSWRGEPRGKHKAGDSWRRPRRLHRLQPVRHRLPDRHRHPRRPCSSNASAAACASTPATRSWSKVDRPRGLITWDTLADQQAKEQRRQPASRGGRSGRAPCSTRPCSASSPRSCWRPSSCAPTPSSPSSTTAAPTSCGCRTATSATATPSRS